MKHTLTSKAAELLRKNGWNRRWRRVFSGMAAVVVFMTTYMLILPAITMEHGYTPEGPADYETVLELEEGRQVTVGVYDPDGCVPDGAQLVARLYEEGDEDYAKAEETLLSSEEVPSYDGMLAMDIHFEDADGVEVEPGGKVYVDLRADLPEDADPETVSVQHHIEVESDDRYGLANSETHTILEVVVDSGEGVTAETPAPTETALPGETALPDGTPVPGETALPEGTPVPGETALPDGTPAPSESVEPSQPVESTEAVEPSQPAESTDVAAPSEPVESTDVAEPSEAVETAEVTEPSQPAESTDVTEPSEPVESTEVAEPSEPAGATEVTESTEAAEPPEAPAEAETSGEGSVSVDTTFGVESFSTFTMTWNVLAEIPETEVPMGGYLCGLEEHTHTETCYDADGNLTCTIPEHTHTEDCLPAADLPLTFPEELPEGYAEYTFDNEDGLSVTAYAPEDAFDGKDVELYAQVLAEDSDEYVQAEKNLADAEDVPEYSGMVAMDIRFVDAAAEDPAAAEEIEPAAEAGPVYVKIDAKALIPEDVDESTLAVQHHAETTDDGLFGTGIFANTEVKVETVADASAETGDVAVLPGETVIPEAETALAAEPGTEESAQPAGEAAEAQTLSAGAEETVEVEAAPAVLNDVEASFGVESFSMFTITWNGQQMKVRYYLNTAGGQEIGGSQLAHVTISNSSSWIPLKDYIGTIEGYEFAYIQVMGYNNWGGYSWNNTKYDENAVIRYNNGQWQIKASSETNNYYARTFYNNGTVGIGIVYQSTEELKPISNDLSVKNTITINLYDYDTKSYGSEVNQGTLKFNGGSDDYYDINRWTGTGNNNIGKDPRQGIVDSELTKNVDADGKVTYSHPTLKTYGDDLSYLFTDKTAGVTAYEQLDGLLQKDSAGYYYYDATQNFAQLNKQTSSFTLYNQQGKLINNQSAQQNVLFMPFNSPTETNVSNFNYHFGMTIGFNFVMPEEGKVNGEDMIFTFTGDDDVWVFIDGTLVLDLGGIHDAITGTINFATGEVTVSGVRDDDLSTVLSDLIETWEDYSPHDFMFYYFERGEGSSNCAIKFNLPAVPTGSISVSKDLNATDDYQQEHSFDTYRMQLIVDGEAQAKTPYVGLDGNSLGTTDENGYFDLADGQTAVFNTIPVSTQNYSVKELGVVRDGQLVGLKTAKFNNVSFNGTAATVSSDGAASTQYTFSSSSTNNVVVKNTPTEGGEDQQFITIQKTIHAEGLTLTAEQLRGKLTDYSISVYKGSTTDDVKPENLFATLPGSSATVSGSNGTYTLVWEVDASSIDVNTNLYLTESGYADLLESENYGWTSSNNFDTRLTVVPASMDFGGFVQPTDCKNNFYSVGDIDFVVAGLTGNVANKTGKLYLVYTLEPVSLSERQAIINYVADKAGGDIKNIGKTDMSKIAFYSQETNPNGFTFGESVIDYPLSYEETQQKAEELGGGTWDKEDGTNYLYFSDPSNWNQFVYGSYEVIPGDMDIETSNTYVPATGDLGIAKIVTRTDNQPASGANFQFSIKVTDSSNDAVTGTYSYDLYSGTYDTATETWNWTIDNPETGAVKNEIIFNANGIETVTGQTASEGSATNCIELDHAQKIVIKGLPVGATAQITETDTSRAGYSTEWTGNTSTNNPVSSNVVTTAAIVAGETPIAVTCTNTTGAVLPSTGGMGVAPYLTLGSLLTLCAGLLMIQRRRKEGSDAV